MKKCLTAPSRLWIFSPAPSVLGCLPPGVAPNQHHSQAKRYNYRGEYCERVSYSYVDPPLYLDTHMHGPNPLPHLHLICYRWPSRTCLVQQKGGYICNTCIISAKQCDYNYSTTKWVKCLPGIELKLLGIVLPIVARSTAPPQQLNPSMELGWMMVGATWKGLA